MWLKSLFKFHEHKEFLWYEGIKQIFVNCSYYLEQSNVVMVFV